MTDERAGARDCSVIVSTEPPDWSDYLAASAEATIYHDPRWGQIMASAYGNRPHFLTARRGGRVVGILQLVAQKGLPFGLHLCSLPYFDAAGVVADDEGARRALLGETRALMERLGAEWVELRHVSWCDPALPGRTDKVTMWLELPSSAEGAWNSLTTKMRTKVRKAQKAAVTLEQGRGELACDFYAIYARTMRDLGSPPHGQRFFRLVCDTFGPAVRLFVVRSEGQPIASALALMDRQGFHVPWSGSDHRAAGGSANRFLFWSMIAYASDAGAARFDFGRSTWGSGTHEFKKEWGAEEVPLCWEYLLPLGGTVPDQRPDSPKYRLLSAMWRHLPVGITRLIGPRIIARLS